MNRNQRKYVPNIKHNEIPSKLKNKIDDDIKEVFPPKSRRNLFKGNKLMANRCCFVSPDRRDVELSTEESGGQIDDHFTNLIKQQYDFDPAIPDTIQQLKKLRKVLCGASKVQDNSSQYDDTTDTWMKTSDADKWLYVNDTKDMDQYMQAEKDDVDPAKPISENVRIHEVPQIKVIAEKFRKFKKNNIELRKLEEKIVCAEYDVFEVPTEKGEHSGIPVQKMRAYFSLKPRDGIDLKTRSVLSSMKREFNINDDGSKKRDEKAIEMIDSKIPENKQYLDDVERLLKRTRDLKIKEQNSNIDVRTLYEIAKIENQMLSAKVFSDRQLNNMMKLILKPSPTSVHGLSRRIIKKPETETENVCGSIYC